MFKINLSQRNDTGRINSSPECNIRPYIKYNQACQPFKIPVSDVDGDVIKCRCSNSVCLAHVVLDEEKCLLTFDPAFPGDYQMEILVEDFPNNMTNISLSTVPVSFIISFATTSNVFKISNSRCFWHKMMRKLNFKDECTKITVNNDCGSTSTTIATSTANEHSSFCSQNS